MFEHHATRCAGSIKKALSRIDVEALGKETSFCKRRRKLTPLRALWTFVTAMACGTTKSLSDIVGASTCSYSFRISTLSRASMALPSRSFASIIVTCLAADS